MKNLSKHRFWRVTGNDDDKDDPLFWSKTLRPHSLGEFSIAVLQASQTMEDQVQVETSMHGTFVGIYDGHVGDDASQFVVEHLFPTFVRFVKEGMNVEDAIREAFRATDEEFLEMVGRTREAKPLMAATGSCCLVGIILAGGTVYVANAGNSRALLGRCVDSHKLNDFVLEQLSEDHKASSSESVKHIPVSPALPGDPNVFELKSRVLGAKGFVQVTRAIGDAYLKKQEFAPPPGYPRFQRPEPLARPVLTAEPSIRVHSFQPNDRFLIFSSSGLWQHLSDQEAAEMVFRSPREGIARRLIRAAIQVAEKKCGVRYAVMKLLSEGGRLACHDDMAVVVVYIDQETIGKAPPNASITGASIRGFIDAETASDFSLLDEIEG